MKVLLLVPVKDSADVFDAWAEHILRLEPKPWKTIFCENDSSDSTLECCNNFPLEKEVITFKMGPVDKNSPDWRFQAIGTARQKLLDRARQLDPDFAIFLDSDMLVRSQDLIEIFATWNLDIVGGAYTRRRVLATFFFNPYDPHSKHFHRRTRPGMALEEVAATGTGCLCLSRKVVQDRRLDFMPIMPIMPWVPAELLVPLGAGLAEDIGYCFKARELGYRVYLESLADLVHFRTPATRTWDMSPQERLDILTFLAERSLSRQPQTTLSIIFGSLARGRLSLYTAIPLGILLRLANPRK